MIYFLGVAVAVVWGLIIYRVFSAVSDSDEKDKIPVSAAAVKDDYNDYSIPEDTTRLLLNYRDPFGIAPHIDTVQKRQRIIRDVAAVLVTPRPPFSWDFIKYSGYIGGKGKKMMAVLAINGRSIMLQEGESSEGVKLLKNYQDSVKVSFKGKTGTIKMQ